jgi:hypothetical protein
MTEIEKHSSLLRYGIIYSHNFFTLQDQVGPGWSFKIFYGCNLWLLQKITVGSVLLKCIVKVCMYVNSQDPVLSRNIVANLLILLCKLDHFIATEVNIELPKWSDLTIRLCKFILKNLWDWPQVQHIVNAAAS